MAAREWWAGVKREVAEVLRDETSRRRSPKMAPVRRENTLTSIPSMITAPASSVGIDPTLALAPTTSTTSTSTQPTTTSSSTSVVQTPTITAAPTATSQASDSDSSGGGISVAATAGIVIGALAGILVIFVLVYLVFSSRRRKLARQRQQIEDDEKINGPFADSAAIRTAPTKAPRLSLRPVTQFLPNFSSQSQAERRASRGIALALNPVSNSSPLTRAAGGSAWDRHTTNPGGDHNRPDTSASLYPGTNPFHDNQRISEEPVSPVSSMSSFDHGRVGLATTTDAMPEPVSPIGGDDDDHHRQLGGAPNSYNNNSKAPASSLSRKTSIRKDLPKPLDLTKPPSPLYAVPPSPAGTEYSMHSVGPGQSPGPSASAAAIAAAGGPASSTVHRVQLDFKPTLQDEMELRAGQLVRLLHEYDDGWALCIRLDRSQQGVVPRTCLSTRPVKPRPAGSGAAGNPRGGPPINPSFHHHHAHHQYNNSSTSNYSNPGLGPGPVSSAGRRPSSPTGGFPPVPVAKDAGYGRPRSPLVGGGNEGGRSPGGYYPDPEMSPAPGQAY